MLGATVEREGAVGSTFRGIRTALRGMIRQALRGIIRTALRGMIRQALGGMRCGVFRNLIGAALLGYRLRSSNRHLGLFQYRARVRRARRVRVRLHRGGRLRKRLHGRLIEHHLDGVFVRDDVDGAHCGVLE
jgi:hypothetical protein